jgi:hypothetical protein
MWLKVNGTNVPNSNSRGIITGPNDAKIVSVEFILPLTAGQYVEVWFASTDITSAATAYVTAAPSPANPSIIFTINRIA